MKTIYKLDIGDVSRIIASYFGVTDSDVSIKVEPTTAGYGTAEHTEYDISCSVFISGMPERKKPAERLDWEKAEEHLNACAEAYKSIGPAGILGLGVIMAIKTKYDCGVRTQDLFDEIMSLE